MKKLKIEEWEEIKKLLEQDKVNVTKICKEYGIARTSLYAYANRRNWFKKKSLVSKILGLFKNEDA